MPDGPPAEAAAETRRLAAIMFTEVLTSDLSKISSLFVIARNSAFTYKGKAVKVQDVGREMGVRYVLEGSVLKADGQVRITAQLIDATTGYHLWAERYDRPLQDILTLQDEIVQKIVTTLRLQLTLQEQGVIVRKHTDNLEAYDAFLRGAEYVFRFTKEATVQARQMYERALALDPQYAEAYERLGWTYSLEWSLRWSADPQTLERALALAQQAVALDDSLPRAHSLLGQVYAQKQQYDQARAEGERAIALDPNNKETISRSPNFLGAHLNLALSYVQQWAFQQSADAQALAGRNGSSPARTPTTRVTGFWALSICGKSSMSRLSPRWSGPSLSDPTGLKTMRVWLRC